MAFHQHILADAVFALEQFFVEHLGDHGHTATAFILAGAPALAVQEGRLEHREEVRRGVAHLDAEGLECIHARINDAATAGHHRLPGGLLLAQQFFGIEARHLRLGFFAGLVALAHARVQLHVEQFFTLVRDGVAGQHLEHGQRGHGRADAQGDGEHHQCGEDLVAAKTA
ncbi:hypothetical protein D3C71_1356910 [compost metagenome]